MDFVNYLEVFEPHIYEDEFIKLPYRLFKPKIKEGEVYPLVVFLHGARERGNDNEKQITANEGATTWANEEFQNKHPCFVLAPQCPENSYWGSSFRVYHDMNQLGPNSLIATVGLVIDELVGKFPIDKDRIYVTGLSMGGFGTIALLTLCPDKFAAGVVVCGGGNPKKLDKIKHIPFWFFHAEDDDVVPVEYSRTLVKKLNELGAEVNYTEYPKGYMQSIGLFPHASWVPAYRDEEMKEWLFSKKRKAPC
ncbi:MAG: alpha/beta fold hydrolase [Fervidobacterium sp.]